MSTSSSPPGVNPSNAPETATTRVLIVDDHRMFGELVAHLLDGQPDFEVIGIAEDAAQALARARAEHPDVVIVDYRLPGSDGVVLAQRLRSDLPDVGLVMLTGDNDDALLRAALSAGCAGFVRKDETTQELVRVVRAVRNREPAILPETVARLASPPSAAARRRGLTARELEVLRLLADGASTHVIAERLFVSLNTARNHVQRVIGKLGAHSRLEAVAIATRSGLLDSRRA